jgi:AmmeMemoRadiSam system protein B
VDAAIREPTAAGRLYPDEPAVLAGMVDGLMDVTPHLNSSKPAAAYVAPHAAYESSGRTASYVYSRLRQAAGVVRRVILLGPAHTDPIRGCAVPSAAIWLTPLGPVAVDVDGAAAVAAVPGVRVDDGPHAGEYSLEVQLPFLQRALGKDLVILPIVVGPAIEDEVRDVISAAVASSPIGTVIVCSTDLSHDLDTSAALVKDALTVQAVLDLAPDRIGVEDACGIYALRGLLGYAQRENLAPGLLHLSTMRADADKAAGYTAMELT